MGLSSSSSIPVSDSCSLLLPPPLLPCRARVPCRRAEPLLAGLNLRPFPVILRRHPPYVSPLPARQPLHDRVFPTGTAPGRFGSHNRAVLAWGGSPWRSFP